MSLGVSQEGFEHFARDARIIRTTSSSTTHVREQENDAAVAVPN